MALPDAGRAGDAIPKLRLDGIAKHYGATVALEPTTLEVVPGELLTILGPSGSGKTTLLQIVSGLVEPSAGRLFIDGQDHTHTPAYRRDVGVVFQNYALFPHLTVEENVAFPLQMRRVPAAERRRRTLAALEMVGLADLAPRLPRALSGGQQQRIALARCLVYQPSIVLMDEPLGALDKKLREAMQVEIKRLLRAAGATTLFVTHDQEEALALSDRICLMNHARIEQIDTPRALYRHPVSLFAADFIGTSNILRGSVSAGMIATADGILPLPCGVLASSGAIVLRPEDLMLTGCEPMLSGIVVESVYAGADTRLLVRLGSGTVLTVRQKADVPAPAIGATVGVRWSANAALFYPT